MGKRGYANFDEGGAMVRLKWLLWISYVTAAASIASFVVAVWKDDLFPVGLAIFVGALGSAICLAIAIGGIRAYGRAGSWLLLAVPLAGFAPLAVLATVSRCMLGACD